MIQNVAQKFVRSLWSLERCSDAARGYNESCRKKKTTPYLHSSTLLSDAVEHLLFFQGISCQVWIN